MTSANASEPASFEETITYIPGFISGDGLTTTTPLSPTLQVSPDVIFDEGCLYVVVHRRNQIRNSIGPKFRLSLYYCRDKTFGCYWGISGSDNNWILDRRNCSPEDLVNLTTSRTVAFLGLIRVKDEIDDLDFHNVAQLIEAEDSFIQAGRIPQRPVSSSLYVARALDRLVDGGFLRRRSTVGFWEELLRYRNEFSNGQTERFRISRYLK